MDELKMPDAFAGFSLEAHETVAEEVVTQPVAAVHITRRRGQRQINITEVFIGTQIGPCINGACVLPRPVLPGFDAKLALLRNNSERPSEFAGLDIIAANIATSSLPDVRIIGD